MILKAKRILSKNINRIKVPSEFIENPPKPEKVITKTAKFFETDELEKKTKKKVKIIMVRDIARGGAKMDLKEGAEE